MWSNRFAHLILVPNPLLLQDHDLMRDLETAGVVVRSGRNVHVADVAFRFALFSRARQCITGMDFELARCAAHAWDGERDYSTTSKLPSRLWAVEYDIWTGDARYEPTFWHRPELPGAAYEQFRRSGFEVMPNGLRALPVTIRAASTSAAPEVATSTRNEWLNAQRRRGPGAVSETIIPSVEGMESNREEGAASAWCRCVDTRSVDRPFSPAPLHVRE